jgi:hypothetical protein
MGVRMPTPHAGTRGHDPGHSWQRALRGNGAKPTIYPHGPSTGHKSISGHPAKSDPFGRWSMPYKGKRS